MHINKADKPGMMSQKKHIQKRFFEEMGLHVDKPKQNGNGNTNDGSTTRRALSDYKLFASILNFDVDVLQNF